MEKKPKLARLLIVVFANVFMANPARSQAVQQTYYAENYDPQPGRSSSEQSAAGYYVIETTAEQEQQQSRAESPLSAYYAGFLNAGLRDLNESESTLSLYFDELIRGVAQRIALKYNSDRQTVEEFIRAAFDRQYQIGIPAPVIVAIALNESSFNSALFIRTGNPFGIKASGPWDGPTYPMWHDGEMTHFRVYGSAEEALLDFSGLIHSRYWYEDALSCPFDNFECFVRGMEKGETEPGYALDPNWGDNILRLIEENELQPLCRR